MHHFRVASQRTKTGLSLALQGGGSLGAFTWGAIDALLDANIAINAVSGASAGAINAVVLAQGLLDGGAAGARARLERVWRRVSNASPLSGLPAGGAALAALQTSFPILSPAQVNPLRIDPLREILAEEIDFARLKEQSAVRLFVSATRVRDGRARIFRNEDLTLEAVLASACLPLLNHSVEIDGEYYWDGGYSANPPLRELALATPDDDILIVDLTTPGLAKPPRLPREISMRVHEIALSASFYRELEAVEALVALGQNGGGRPSRDARKLGAMRLHRLIAADRLKRFAPGAHMDVDWRMLTALKEAGGQAVRVWLRRDAPTAMRPGRRVQAGPVRSAA